MAKQFGIPYMGSKDSIAEWVVNRLPSGRHFYDLFAGGCAITHAALLLRNFESYHANDIDPRPTRLFIDAVKGVYANECRWISRQDFEALKASSGYIAYCWSFGNKGDAYLYAKETESWRKAMHYAVFFQDLSHFRKFGIADLYVKGRTPGERYLNLRRQFTARHLQRYREWLLSEWFGLKGDELEAAIKSGENDVKREEERLRAYLRGALKASGISASDVDRHLGTNGMSGHYFGASQWAFPTPDAYAKMQQIMPAMDRPYGECATYLAAVSSLQSLQSLQRLQRLESLQSLQRLQSLQSLQRLQSLEITAQSYDEVPILPGSVIYCDIPYAGTAEYTCGAFDYERFYDWAQCQDSPVIVSSYDMPDSFQLVAATGKRQLLAAQGPNKMVREGLYVPKTQIAKGIYKI